MKKTIMRFFPAVSVLALAAGCFGIEDADYRELEPITLTALSDTISARQGIELVYKGLKVESALNAACEWAYGVEKNNSTATNRIFSSLKVISTAPTINYTFPDAGAFTLRLKVDNGECIVYKYFTLNVDSGFDEGLLVLDNDAGGKAYLSFLKTLSADQQAAGEEDFFPDIFSGINPAYSLVRGTDVDMMVSGKSKLPVVTIATNDGEGTLYKLDATTLTVFSVNRMTEFGSWCKELGWEGTSSFSVNFVGADREIYAFDVESDFITSMTDMKKVGHADRVSTPYNRSNAASGDARWTVAFSADSIFCHGSSSRYDGQGFPGYEIINVACRRTASASEALYVLLKNTEDGTYEIRSGNRTVRSPLKKVAAFAADPLKMDRNSRLVNSKNTGDIYYSYDDDVYRWSLTSPPGSAPAIDIPDGERIVDLAVNFKHVKGEGGEDLLYVLTVNPDRPGDKKGSLFVYRFSDDTQVKSYEGVFHGPVGMAYKYRTN